MWQKLTVFGKVFGDHEKGQERDAVLAVGLQQLMGEPDTAHQTSLHC